MDIIGREFAKVVMGNERKYSGQTRFSYEDVLRTMDEER